MRRLMMLTGLAFVASVVLAAVGASSASAAEIFLTNAAYPQNVVTTDNNSSVFSTGNTTFTCASLLGKGTLLSPKKLLLSLLWHKCTDNLGRPCLSVGAPTGLIAALLLVLPVWLNKAQTLPGLLFERHQGNADFAHFHCWSATLGTTLELVRGVLLGHIPKPAPKVKSHTFELEFKETSTSQEFEKVEEGAEVFKLEVSLNGGAFNPLRLEVIKDVVEFEKAGVESEFR